MLFTKLTKNQRGKAKNYEKNICKVEVASEWLELRCRCQNMLKQILYQKPSEYVKSVKYTRDNEKLAIDQLSQQEKVIIQPCGLYIDPDVPYLDTKPDGIKS